jgi:rubredoxin
MGLVCCSCGRCLDCRRLPLYSTHSRQLSYLVAPLGADHPVARRKDQERMSYRCEMCHLVMPPKTPATRVVLAIQPSTYPVRLNAHRDPIHHLPQRGEIRTLTPTEAERFRLRRTRDPRDDAGGSGYEIVKEAIVCPQCWQKCQSAPSHVIRSSGGVQATHQGGSRK